MLTQKVKINPNNIDKKIIKALGNIISEGGLCAFPTETVYGLGANAFSAEACMKIFKAKGRPADNPLIVHVNSIEEAEKIVLEIPQMARVLFEKFSPGPITVIMKKAECIPHAVTAGLGTVAVRIPSHPIARALIAAAGVPIAAPSANRSKKPSPTKAEHVIADMDGRIDAIINGGGCDVGVESTVVDMTGDVPVILRPGGISYEALLEIMPNARVDRHVIEAVQVTETPKCPGMKYEHYSPDADVFVVEGEKEKVCKKIAELIKENSGKRIGVISLGGGDYEAELILDAGNSNREYASCLFDYLRECDNHSIDIVFAEFVFEDEYALAVKNRLYKSAGNKVIRV